MQGISQSRERMSLLPITLTELVLILFFLLLMLFTVTLASKKQEIADLRETTQQLENALSDYETNPALREFRTTLATVIAEFSVDDKDDFIDLIRDLQKQPATTTELRSELREANDRLETLKAEASASEALAGQHTREFDALKGRLAHYRRVSGYGLPPCWTTPEGRVEFLYAVVIRESDLSVSPAWPTYRQSDLAQIPGASRLPQSSLTLADFRREAKPILDWSDAQECRHYALISNGADSADAYETIFHGVTQFFYFDLDR